MMPARTRLAVIVVTVLIGAGIGYAVQHFLFAPPSGTAREGRGFGEALVGGPFSLVDQDGKRRTDADFRGKLMLVNFGFTNCPDICPLGMALMGDTLERLGPDADKLQPIFITVDPARDTAPVLKDYIAHFSDRIVGLTGSKEEIAAAAKAYRVYYKVHGDPATNPNYAVDHSGFLYLMSRDGKFITHFMHDTPADRVAETIRKAL
jgi:cytochrome oxidase Cu insertion factor (SCO1/SenC/PrrC family)